MGSAKRKRRQQQQLQQQQQRKRQQHAQRHTTTTAPLLSPELAAELGVSRDGEAASPDAAAAEAAMVVMPASKGGEKKGQQGHANARGQVVEDEVRVSHCVLELSMVGWWVGCWHVRMCVRG